MISSLTGILIEKQAPVLVVEVGNGVGYEVEAPMTTFYDLPELGHKVSLHTHLSIREDAHVLYGFAKRRDRDLFRRLIKVNGVGPKLGLAILSSMEANLFVNTVLNGDSAQLVRLPGVGKKTAERLIIEMRDRLKDWYQGEPEHLTTKEVMKTTAKLSMQDDAVHALLALGYKPQEASRMVAKVAHEDIESSEELIRLALKEMMA